MAIADVYDALISDHCYKKGFSHKKSYDIITKEKGKHFAPVIAEAFVQTHEIFKKISSPLIVG